MSWQEQKKTEGDQMDTNMNGKSDSIFTCG